MLTIHPESVHFKPYRLIRGAMSGARKPKRGRSAEPATVVHRLAPLERVGFITLIVLFAVIVITIGAPKALALGQLLIGGLK
jgi:hypothetical protein